MSFSDYNFIEIFANEINDTVARIIKVTEIFDDVNAAQTGPSLQTESSKKKQSRRARRIDSHQVIRSGARIKSTISRDAREQELPYLSFTTDDLGHYVDVETMADKIANAGSMEAPIVYNRFERLQERARNGQLDHLQEHDDYDQFELSRERGEYRRSDRSREYEEYDQFERSRERGEYRRSVRSRGYDEYDQLELSRERDSASQSTTEERRVSEVRLRASDRGASRKISAAASGRRSNVTSFPTTKVRARRSLPELTSNSLGTEYLHGRIMDRTYLEHISVMRSSGTNPTARFIETLMDDINRLRSENMFLGEQLAIQQQVPERGVREHVSPEDSRRSQDVINSSRIIRRVVRRPVSSSSSPRRSIKSTSSSDTLDALVSATEAIQSIDSSSGTGSRNYQILHKIDCSSHRHDDVFRSQPPLVTGRQPLESTLNEPKKLCLREQGTIVHPDDLIQNKPHLSFIVIRFYTCIDIAYHLRLMSDRGKNTTSATNTSDTVTRNVFKPSEEAIGCLSKYLQIALEDCAQCEPLERDTNVDIPRQSRYLLSPYHFVHQHRSVLEAYARENQGPTSEDIENLLKYFAEVFGEKHAAADNLFAQGLFSNHHLLNLFRPNTLVFSKKVNQAFMLSSWPQQQGNRLALKCWSWKYDGLSVIRQPMSLEVICDSEGLKHIADLDCYPIQFAETATQQLIRRRGETFWNLKDPGIVCYNGRNADDTDHHIEARFMIDYDLHKKYHPTSQFFLDTSDTEILEHNPYDPWPTKITRGPNVDGDMLMLMPLKIDGFNLQTKSWELLFVDNISKVKWHKAAFTRLVLPSRTKDLIRAMIVGRKVEKQSSDIFYGKGNGLIMLLHGSPGTGKTLSAESVAELAEKPLYRVTCGDIGTEVDDVEEYLDMILSIGKRWDCVLLLDEADVFLEERSLADLKRNSLVSVFLRVLEYYEGILILTSNRVGIFDEAFKSRIQVALHYDKLPRSARKKIWSNFFELMQEEQVDADFAEIESHVDDLAAFELNGRQIRNAVTTARQLARFQNETLDYDHIQTVMKTVNDFNRYIEKVHGHQDDKWARDGGLR